MEATEEPQKQLKSNQRWVKGLPTPIAFFRWIAKLSSMEAMQDPEKAISSIMPPPWNKLKRRWTKFLFIDLSHSARLKHNSFQIEGGIWQLVQRRVYYDVRAHQETSSVFSDPNLSREEPSVSNVALIVPNNPCQNCTNNLPDCVLLAACSTCAKKLTILIHHHWARTNAALRRDQPPHARQAQHCPCCGHPQRISWKKHFLETNLHRTFTAPRVLLPALCNLEDAPQQKGKEANTVRDNKAFASVA